MEEQTNHNHTPRVNPNTITKIFLDTEFTGLHQSTTLISIGLISECGKTFYAELTDYDKSQIYEWLQINVIDKLIMSEPKEGEDEYYSATRHADNPKGNNLYDSYSVQLRCNMEILSLELSKWLFQFEKVEIWSDSLAYDWVLFSKIFGHTSKIPMNVYYIPFDIATLFKIKGIDPDTNREVFACGEPNNEDSYTFKHNALWDAKIIKACYEKLTQDPTSRVNTSRVNPPQVIDTLNKVIFRVEYVNDQLWEYPKKNQIEQAHLIGRLHQHLMEACDVISEYKRSNKS
jgi:hypothetical protein